ncbi:MAG: hypothetical protein GQ564_05285 [Bacteroidales bacterium]|nr:hypothetical protein [Bacteroidales bacterium]
MQKQIFVCGTLFHIYISILKILEYKKKGSIESLLIVNDHTPGIQDLITQLNERKYFTNIIYIPFFEITYRMEKQESIIKRIFKRDKLSIKYVEEGSSIKEYYDFIKNAEINLFYNLGLVSSFFLINFKLNYFRMLEDGYRNYNPRVNAFKAFKRKYILRTVIGEGRDKIIKSIEVQYPERLPKIVLHKGKRLNLSEMQKNLSKKEKEDLLTTFLKEKSIEIKNSKNLLLITQPLSEDRVISEDLKVEVYKNLLDKYAIGYKVYIKTHPRETTNYISKLQHEFIEIPRSFPLEFLDFMDNVNFDLGITLFSSALDNISCVKKRIFIGKNYIEKIALR